MRDVSVIRECDARKARGNSVIGSLASGSVSGAATTIIYQPLELIKTKIQLQENRSSRRLFGKITKSTKEVVQKQGISYLWRGTYASLLRSVPGVGLYYAALNGLQTTLSGQNNKPDNPAQAFYVALTARSMVSFLLLPITVVKVRYESGYYEYPSLQAALREAYFKNGWVGVAPTIIRDSLFSGTYYMCYTELKTCNFIYDQKLHSFIINRNTNEIYRGSHSLNFTFGIISGLIASILTNPLDVLKTHIQVRGLRGQSMFQITLAMLKEKHGAIRFLDGLVPRSLRRTLIAASTWTFYEYLLEVANKNK